MIPLIAFAGPQGVGKSTLADELKARFHCKRRSFAEPLRGAVAAVFGCAYRTQWEKQITDPFWSKRLGSRYATGRDILRTFGTDVCRNHVHPDLWLFATEKWLEAWSRTAPAMSTAALVFDDCRFANEAAWIRARGGIVCHLRRAGIAYSGAHVTEQGVPHEAGDWIIDLGSDAMLATACARIALHIAKCQD